MKSISTFKHFVFVSALLQCCLSASLADLARDAGKVGVVGEEGEWTMENSLQLEQDNEGKTWSIESGIQHAPDALPGVSFLLETVFQEWDEPKGEPDVSGYGDTELSVYYMLVADEDALPAIVIGGRIAFGTAKSPELGTGKEDYGVILIVGKEFGELDVNLEIEFETFGQPDPVIDEDGEIEEEEKLEDQISFTLGADYGLTENLSMYAEVFGSTEETKSAKDESAIGGGLEYDIELTEDLAVFVEAGVDTDKLITAALGMELSW